MAIIDDTRGVLVVRIVYDGPALSGKTTSLRALAKGVSSKVECPAELAGRTLFFDWVDYVGGLFDGRQIRCQIVSVPGQKELAHRRKLLIETADALVLVLDTRRMEWEFGLGWVRDTVPFCRGKSPPVGLVLQANKRDAPDAVSTEEIQRSLQRVTPVAVVPSTATSGEGIREAFVLAVRLALDRVRALAAAGQLHHGKPDEDDAAELLSRMQSAEREPAAPLDTGLAQSALASLEAEIDAEVDASKRELRAENPSSHDSGERLFVPDPMMPGGMIWPPVDGRALLHEVASLDIRPVRTSREDWAGSGSGFRFHSQADAIFPDSQTARNELLEWARLHSANNAHLSPGRAVILADAGNGRLRLWQIVRSEATLRERLASACQLPEATQVADELIGVVTQLAVARESFEDTTVHLPCTLWTVGSGVSYRPTFVGLMPSRHSNIPSEPRGRELLLRELSPQLRELRRTRVDYAEVVTRVVARAEFAAREAPARWLAEIVQAT
ncbi:MAG TPA: GTPase domain-containing protein [Polyangiaceae bacterium]|nr:GTPase domain-containing protein [Polyangiaceae bacterium]